MFAVVLIKVGLFVRCGSAGGDEGGTGGGVCRMVGWLVEWLNG